MSRNDELAWLDKTFDQLFPICRSITGPGLRKSLEILRKDIPITIESFKTGESVHDWKVPQEWIMTFGRLTGPDGKVYADFEKSNLHVINCSTSVDKTLSLEELQPYLHSIEELPQAVPYVTSYYSRTWGFCLSHEERQKLPPGNYHAEIKSSFVDGELNLGHTLLRGESEREFLISSYLCHPSLANNELSGPLVLTALYTRMAKWKKRRYSYRFVLLPETIGSICYLSRFGVELKKNLDGGLVLTCLGGKNTTLSYKSSRRENTLLDTLVKEVKVGQEKSFRYRVFSPTDGSDERQYCSPGYNLPVGQVARDVYGEYDGYHNSLDTKEFMNIEQLQKSVDEIEKLILDFEYAGKFENLSPFGEPKLGERGLYPTLNSHSTWSNSTDTKLDGRAFLNTLLTILNYSDGTFSMLDISKKCGHSLEQMKPVIDKLEEVKLLKLKGDSI